MKRHDLAAALILAAIVMTGCQSSSSSKPTSTGTRDVALTGLLIQPEQASEIGYRIDWQTHLALSENSSFEHVSVFGDLIATLEEGNYLSLIRARDGAILWRNAVGNKAERFSKPYRTQYSVGGRPYDVVLVSSPNRVYIFDVTNGNQIGDVTLDYTAATDPLILDNFAIYGTVNGLVFAQNLRDGFHHWKYQMASSIPETPTRMGQSIVIIDNKGGIAALNPLTGGLLWRRLSPPWDRIAGRPAAIDSITFVPSADRTLYAFERNSGRILWRIQEDVPLRDAPTLLNERLYQWVPGTGLRVIDIFTGTAYFTLDEQLKPFMTVDRETVFIKDDNTLVYINADNGEVNASHTIRQADIIAADATNEGNLILFNHDGRVMKLRPTR